MSEFKVLTPQMVWQDYCVDALPFEGQILEEFCNWSAQTTVYSFLAHQKNDSEIRAIMKVYSPLSGAKKRTVLIAPEYDRDPDYNLIVALVARGCCVAVPDLSGEGTPATTYSGIFSYGKFSEAGDHVRKVMPTAKDTCQYLYTIIVKRAALFLKNEGYGIPVLVGLSDAVEVAMAAVGTGTEVVGLAAFNGSGYREYIRLNKYGDSRELELDEERLAWLSGVASVAYAKFVNVPVFLSIGTNSRKADPDRVANLIALLPHDRVHIVFSPRACDYLDPDAFRSFEIWSSAMFNEFQLPECPELEIRVAEDGKIYFEVNCDVSSILVSASIYYSYGVYQHGVRDWLMLDGESISANSFLASPELYDHEGPLFAYAEVRYLTGLTLSSTVEYMFLGGKSVPPCDISENPVIFDAELGESSGFVEEYKGDVLVESGIRTVVSPFGVKGVTTKYDALTTYHFRHEAMHNGSILRLDLLSEGDSEVEVAVLCVKEDGGVRRFAAKDTVCDTKGMFVGHRFSVTDFKDRNYLPLRDWKSVRSLSIKGRGVAVGNIIII